MGVYERRRGIAEVTADLDAKAYDDLRFKLMLVLVRDRRAMQGRIRSVRFMREYGQLPEDLGAVTLSRMSAEEHLALAEGIGIKPKPAGAKSDIYLNDVGFRIQALSLHPAVVADGLTLEGLMAVCRRAGASADGVEACLRAFWSEKGAGGLNAETELGAAGAPFSAEKESWTRVVSYLLFTGGEQGDSMFAADGLLDYTDPMNTETWATLGKEEAVDALWTRLRIRAEGGRFETARFAIWAPAR